MDLLDESQYTWEHYTEDRDDYRVSYWGTVLNIHDDGRLDVLYRWDPGASCHYHRHIAPLTSVVLKGELTLIDFEDNREVGRRVRKVGSYSNKETVEDHIEVGGPEGALVLFCLRPSDGVLTQRLSDDGEVLATITVDDIRARQAAIL